MLSNIGYNNIKVLLITIYNVRGKGCQNFQDEMLTVSHD